MIKTERQLQASMDALKSLNEKLEAPMKPDIPERIAAAAKDQVRYMIEKVELEIREYLAMMNETEFTQVLRGLDDIRKIPILLRLFKSMTMEQFARASQLNLRQVQRYEKEEYSNIGITAFLKILELHNVCLSGKVKFNRKKNTFATNLILSLR